MAALTRMLLAEAEATGEDWKNERNRSLVSRINSGYKGNRVSSDADAVEDAIESLGWPVFEDGEEDTFTKAEVRSAIAQGKKLGLIGKNASWSWEA